MLSEVKARFLRSEENGDFVRQPNAKWYVKPAMDDYDPRLLVPMQAKIAEYIRGECTNPDSTEDRTVQLNQLDDVWFKNNKSGGWLVSALFPLFSSIF